MLLAWFALSNHCMLSAACVAAPMAKGCPMHVKSSEKTPSENGANQPCCKTLRAVTVSENKGDSEHARLCSATVFHGCDAAGHFAEGEWTAGTRYRTTGSAFIF